LNELLNLLQFQRCFTRFQYDFCLFLEIKGGVPSFPKFPSLSFATVRKTFPSRPVLCVLDRLMHIHS
jgi:hypothetical protein